MRSKNIPTLKSCRIKVGITIGDPSGIGPGITLKAMHKLKGLADFIVIGDAWVLKQASSLKCQASGVKLIDLGNVKRKNFSFGKVKAEYGKASIEYLDKVLELIKNKEIDCLVTCPISKEAINLAGFNYSGHTEYFAERTGYKDTVMMLLNKQLKFSLVTRHIPLRSVSQELNAVKINKVIYTTVRGLKELFLIKNPRRVVCGLNPHASDNGLIGNEENKIILPALKKLKHKMGNIFGPLPADVAIARAREKLYDCVIVMYHDQALIPLKLLGSDTGVNITLGLPFVRTSPLHGTAFDIAPTRAARPHSLIESIKLAIKCTINQRKD